jgi:chromosome segregation ATPase
MTNETTIHDLSVKIAVLETKLAEKLDAIQAALSTKFEHVERRISDVEDTLESRARHDKANTEMKIAALKELIETKATKVELGVVSEKVNALTKVMWWIGATVGAGFLAAISELVFRSPVGGG